MPDERSNPLLAQVPLTVHTPLPAAATLPYTYKAMPSTLPAPTTPGLLGGPSSSSEDASSGDAGTGAGSGSGSGSTTPAKPKYVVSSSAGHAAHPDDIIASCRALQAHIAGQEQRLRGTLDRFASAIRDRDLAEKRRVAPGWLDSDSRLLEPERRLSEADGTESSAAAGLAEGAGGDGLVGSAPVVADGPVGAAAAAAAVSSKQNGNGGLSFEVAGEEIPASQFRQMSIAEREGASEMAVDKGAELDRVFGAR